MARRRKKRNAETPMAYQDSPEQIWRKWEAMHGSKATPLNPLDAIKQSTWVYAATTFIAEGVSRTRLRPFVGDKPLEDHPIMRFVDRPTTYVDQNTSSKYRYAYLMEMLLHGSLLNVFGEMQGFRPTTMTVRPRWHFNVRDRIDEAGRYVPTEWTLRGNRGQGSMRFIPGDNVCHDALYNPMHDYEGLSPLTAAVLSVAADGDIMEFSRRYFENDGSTGVVFSTENPAFDQKKADDAAKKWKDQYSGLRNAFGVKFLGFGLTPHSVGTLFDPKMMQVLRGFTRDEILSGVYKVPPDAIFSPAGGGDIVIGGPSGGTQASAREAFLINCAIPWAMRYDECFNRDVAWRFGDNVEVRHDFTDNPVLERRRLERAKGAVELIDRGVPLNEVIRWLRLDIAPQPWGNDFWVNKEKLPARVVLNAGDDAIRIAIPDPVAPQRNQALVEYVASVINQAASSSFAESVRHDEAVRQASNGKSNGNRVAELLGAVRLHLGSPVGARRESAPPVN